jgi:hypothetical protein
LGPRSMPFYFFIITFILLLKELIFIGPIMLRLGGLH